MAGTYIESAAHMYRATSTPSSSSSSPIPFPNLPSHGSPSPSTVPFRLPPMPTAATEPNNIKVYKAEDLQRLTFLRAVGDYSGRVFNSVKRAAEIRGKKFPDSVVSVDQRLDKDQNLAQMVNVGIDYLQEKGFTINLEMVKLAVGVYAQRNVEFHTGVGHRETANNAQVVEKAIHQDIRSLSIVLPEERRKEYNTWKQVMRFYYDSQAWMKSARSADTQRSHDRQGRQYMTPMSTRKLPSASDPPPANFRKRRAISPLGPGPAHWQQFEALKEKINQKLDEMWREAPGPTIFAMEQVAPLLEQVRRTRTEASFLDARSQYNKRQKRAWNKVKLNPPASTSYN